MSIVERAPSPMRWDSGLETGDMTVDLQHMQLFATVNDLTAAVEMGMPRWEVTDAVFELLRYVGVHFADEEALMQAAGYPHLAEQRQAHQKFAKDMARATTEYFEDKDATAERLLAYTRVWLDGHVDTMDRSLAEYLRAKRAGR